MSLEEALDTDVVTELGGIRFIVDKYIDERFARITVDYGSMFFRKRFTVGIDEDYGEVCYF